MKRLLNLAECLGLLMLLVSCGAQAGAQPVAQISPLAVETPTAPPKVMATPVVAELPLCQFNSIPTSTVSAPPLESYVFSEPKVVLTSTGTIGIVGWLPDSERLLIVQDVPKTNRQTIATFNIQNGELRPYAERERSSAKPVWVSVSEEVAFTTVTDRQSELRISQGDPDTTQPLVSGLSSMFLGIDLAGQQLLYVTENQPQRLSTLSKVAQTTNINLSRWEYPSLEPWKTPGMYRMAWRPGTPQAAFYNSTYFFLADVESGQGCEIDLGKEKGEGGFQLWAVVAQWSPDGRYLAMLTTAGVPPVRRVGLSILDMNTGKLSPRHPEAYTAPGQYYVMGVTWAPDSQTVAILATVEEKEGAQLDGLYLVNVTTGENRRMLPQMTFPGGGAGWNLAWSQDGNYLAITCLHGPLCLVKVTGQ